MADTNELCFQILNSPMKSVNSIKEQLVGLDGTIWREGFEFEFLVSMIYMTYESFFYFFISKHQIYSNKYKYKTATVHRQCTRAVESYERG